MIRNDRLSVEGTAMMTASRRGRITAKTAVMSITTYLGMSVIGFVTLFPFLWMLSTSFKAQNRVMTINLELLPIPFVPQNYLEVLSNPDVPFLLFFYNTAKVTLIVLLLRLIACALAGYAFARLEFPLKNFLFGMLLASMLIPGVVKIVPLYEAYKLVGWLDTHLSIIVEPALANTFGTFLLRQFFLTIPKDLEDAAKVDGAGYVAIFQKVMLPLSGPALAALAIFTFTGTWNSFLDPIIFLKSVNLLTIQPGLAFYGSGGADTLFSPSFYNLIMAGGVMAIIPVLLIYLAFQRYFTQGIVLSGIKG